MSEKVKYWPILKALPSVIATTVRGLTTTHNWPASGTFFVPLLEMTGKHRTPSEVFPVVAALYTYIKTADDALDVPDKIPTPSEVDAQTVASMTLFLSTIAQAFGSSYVQEIAAHIAKLKQDVYNITTEKTTWGNNINWDQAYRYRLITNTAASFLPVEVWCHAADSSESEKHRIMEVAVRTAMVFQHTDDFYDWDSDPPDSGNLVHALMKNQGVNHPNSHTCTSLEASLNSEVQTLNQLDPPVSELVLSVAQINLQRQKHKLKI